MPYRRQNANIMYIIKIKHIIKQIADIINHRSIKKEKLIKVKNDYKLIMENCGYKERLKYKNSELKNNTDVTIKPLLILTLGEMCL